MLLDEDLPQIAHAEVILRLLSQVLYRRSQDFEHLRSEHAWQLVQASCLLLSFDARVAPAAPLSRLLKLALPLLILCQVTEVLALHPQRFDYNLPIKAKASMIRLQSLGCARKFLFGY